ncbi:hypothetical protein PENTCL1PPCAC_26225, partial [Pristionchus entomophagus]
NDFIAVATKNMIQGSFSAEKFEPLGGAFLISTVYFKADWAQQFVSEVTLTQSFYGLGGQRESFMHSLTSAHGGQINGMTYLFLEYSDPVYSLLLIMPNV